MEIKSKFDYFKFTVHDIWLRSLFAFNISNIFVCFKNNINQQNTTHDIKIAFLVYLTRFSNKIKWRNKNKINEPKFRTDLT